MATVSSPEHSPYLTSWPEHKSQEEYEATQVLTQPFEEEEVHEKREMEEKPPAKISKTASLDETLFTYRIPERRYPPVSYSDTIYGDLQSPYHPRTVFVADPDIVRVHRMKHLSDKQAVTMDGKNIFLQQGQRGCAPAAISMISADLKGKILTQEMKRTNITSDPLEEVYIKRAGFTPLVRSLLGYPHEKVQQLEKLVAEGGPGILHIQTPQVGGHVVVLDAITDSFVTFRDPYHGWMITMKTSTFRAWISSRFVQFQLPRPLQRAETL